MNSRVTLSALKKLGSGRFRARSVTPPLLAPRLRLTIACGCLVLLSSCASAPIWFPEQPVKSWFHQHLAGLPAEQLEEQKTTAQ